MTTLRGLSIGLAIVFLAVNSTGQATSPAAINSQKASCDSQVRSTYLLGPEDELQISGPELDELSNKTVRVDGEGDLQVPLVGRVHVAGLTVQQAEQELNKRLTTYIKHPQAAVDVKELRSQPASILGAVNSPGVHQVEGHKTLLEMISLAGGVRPDTVAQVNLQDIMEAKTPQENIQIFPHDVISVPKAELVYVTGDVKKSGGYILGERQTMSVLQAVSLAEGLGPAPDPRHAKILRLNPGQDQRTEIPVDLKKILQGKGGDVPLQGNDILFVPDSTGKKVALRVMEAAISTGTGLAIYRP
jgi:polysaccharide export outer membrane protein